MIHRLDLLLFARVRDIEEDWRLMVLCGCLVLNDLFGCLKARWLNGIKRVFSEDRLMGDFWVFTIFGRIFG